jgi:sulfur carrier protein ThiS
MRVKVRLYTILKKYGEGKIDGDGSIDLPDRATLKGLQSYLSIPDKKGKVFIVNGAPKDAAYTLHEGDEVKILAFIGGG